MSRLAPTLLRAALLAWACALLPLGAARADDEALAEERALARASERAVKRLAPCVVSIEALGGLPRKHAAPKNEGEKQKGILVQSGFKQANGPSTGLVIREDGLIVTSTFALAQQPRHIFVTLADGRSFVAKELGRDDSRALALLKIEAKGLPVAEPAPAALCQVGRFTLAVGRGLGSKEPVVSLGIVSAVERIGGRAIQSSALISPVNYGGPLAGIDGSVFGVIVPLALEGGMASIDIYDSGIGFAIPLQDVLAVAGRLERGHRLRAGVLGVVPDTNHKGEGVRVKSVAPGSPAAAAGLEEGDIIVEVDGAGTHAIWMLKRALARRFAGEEVRLKVIRDRGSFEKAIKLAAPPKGAEGPDLEHSPAPEGHGQPGEGKPGEGKPGEGKPDEGKPDETPSEEEPQ
ncbi:MAG: trypsin-like peptidase domain-containing protein [Planctomycetota bacterium]